MTCIHVSSIWRSGDPSGDEIAGGKGWISFGTTTRSLPKTKIAPALFAVPVQRGKDKLQMLNHPRGVRAEEIVTKTRKIPQ
jgi:hypothetical protein